MFSLLRPYIFSLDPEVAHDLAIQSLKANILPKSLFDVEGEEGFRDREEQVIRELSAKTGAIIATGGGVVEREENRKRIAEKGTVIHLDCPNETLVERVRNDKKRPLLQGSEVDQVLMTLKKRRDPLYTEIADYKFISDKQTTSALVRAIIARLDR